MGKTKRQEELSDDEDYLINKKKLKVTKKRDIFEENVDHQENQMKYDFSLFASIKDTSPALDYLKSIFPADVFDLPPIMYKHQMYSMLPNKTKVDRELEDLRNSNKIRLFKADANHDDILICYTSDFRFHLEKNLFNFEKANIKQIKNNYTEAAFKRLINLFMNDILESVKELSITQNVLKNSHNLNETDITILIQAGLLTIKDSKSWWFAIPFVGNFRRTLIEARKSIVFLLRKKKFNEVVVNELYKRNMKKLNQIGIPYLCCDLLGSETVKKIESSMGFVIKLI